MYTEEGYDYDNGMDISVNYNFMNNNGRTYTDIDQENQNNFT